MINTGSLDGPSISIDSLEHDTHFAMRPCAERIVDFGDSVVYEGEHFGVLAHRVIGVLRRSR